jgi:very-short-patch-repair endonuclease
MKRMTVAQFKAQFTAGKLPKRKAPARRGKPISLAEEGLYRALQRVAPESGWDLCREHVFHPTRKWRFDFAFPSVKLAIEVDGRGRHQTVTGARADHEKQNAAIALGWKVMRFAATDKKYVMRWAAEILAVWAIL